MSDADRSLLRKGSARKPADTNILSFVLATFSTNSVDCSVRPVLSMNLLQFP